MAHFLFWSFSMFLDIVQRILFDLVCALPFNLAVPPSFVLWICLVQYKSIVRKLNRGSKQTDNSAACSLHKGFISSMRKLFLFLLLREGGDMLIRGMLGREIHKTESTGTGK